MSANGITISATFEDGKPLAVLSDLIRKRQDRIKGETTETAVIATAINVLSSIRPRTKKANPIKAAKFGVEVRPAPGVVHGYAKGRSVARIANYGGNPGHVFNGAKIVSLMGAYVKGQTGLVNLVIIKSPKVMKRIRGGFERVYVISRTAKEAREWAEKKVRNYVKQYGGTADLAIAYAQSMVSQKPTSTTRSGKAKAVASKNVIVKKESVGFSDGAFSVSVEDNLDYAKLALENGERDLDMAIKKAANRTAAIINNMSFGSLKDDIKTPFPEAKGVRIR